jgi:glutathione S-transferase
MNLKARHPGFKVWAGAQADIDRVISIWKGCFIAYGGPYLFGAKPVVADAMYAPVCTRFDTYDVKLDRDCAVYRDLMLHHPFMQEWRNAAQSEEDELEELDVEF